MAEIPWLRAKNVEYPNCATMAAGYFVPAVVLSACAEQPPWLLALVSVISNALRLHKLALQIFMRKVTR